MGVVSKAFGMGAAVVMMANAALAEMSEEAFVALMTSVGDLPAQEHVKARDAAYATCLLLGSDPEQAAASFNDAAWTVDPDDSDDTVTAYVAPGSETLKAIVDRETVSCAVWSGETGTVAAGNIAGGLLTMTTLPLEVLQDDEGCDMTSLAVEGEGVIVLQVAEGSSGDYACSLSDEAASLVIFTAVAQE